MRRFVVEGNKAIDQVEKKVQILMEQEAEEEA